MLGQAAGPMSFTKNGAMYKIVKGDLHRKTRFHDEKGHLVGAWEIPHVLPAISSYVKNYFGIRPKVPWLCYSSIPVLDGLIGPNWNVIEFGSGMSTLYFAKRARSVVSIEHSEEWGNRVEDLISEAGVSNVRLDVRSWEGYEDCSEWKDGYFDFCLVDGVKRLACVKSVIPKIRQGGYVYMDDSDVVRDPERLEAERLILQAGRQRGANPPIYFVDFAPALLHAKEAMLAQL
jgi:Methyltransferase domain